MIHDRHGEVLVVKVDSETLCVCVCVCVCVCKRAGESLLPHVDVATQIRAKGVAEAGTRRQACACPLKW